MARKSRKVEKIEEDVNKLQEEYIKELETPPADTLTEEEMIALGNMPVGDEPPVMDQPVVDQPVVDQPVADPPPVKSDDWEHKYSVLQGKYDSEVPALSAQIRTLTAEVSNLQGVIAAMDIPTENTTPTPSSFEIGDEGVASLAKFKDEYPQVAEYVDVFVKNSLRGFADDFITPVATKIDGFAQTANTDRLKRFEDDMTNAVNNWRTINVDPEFMKWLSVVEPFSGQTRLSLLQRAHASRNSETAIGIFKAFLNEKQPEQVPGAIVAEEDLSALNPPAAPSPAVKIEQGEKKFVSRAFIKAFYNDVALGRYEDRPQEADAISRGIDKAIKENRVT